MDNFKEASRQALRFVTSKGNLTTEQLWDLKLPELDVLAVSLEIQAENSGKKSFLKATTAKDKIAKLKFNIVLDILTTKAEEQAEASKKKEDKAHNEKIYALIAEQDEKDLKGKTKEELLTMLK